MKDTQFGPLAYTPCTHKCTCANIPRVLSGILVCIAQVAGAFLSGSFQVHLFSPGTVSSCITYKYPPTAWPHSVQFPGLPSLRLPISPWLVALSQSPASKAGGLCKPARGLAVQWSSTGGAESQATGKGPRGHHLLWSTEVLVGSLAWTYRGLLGG